VADRLLAGVAAATVLRLAAALASAAPVVVSVSMVRRETSLPKQPLAMLFIHRWCTAP
jgi:hypothetical protein